MTGRASLLFGACLSVLSVMSAAQAAEVDGETLYDTYCAMCHTDPTDVRAPDRQALEAMNANSIHRALTEGIMRAQAASLSESEIIVLSEYLTNDQFDIAVTPSVKSCDKPMPEFELSLTTNWNSWGNGLNNHRFQSQTGTRVNADTVNNLELVWAFGLENASVARSQPTVINNTMIMGSPSGTVYALDLESGCAYWTYPATTEARANITVAFSQELNRYLAVVGDMSNRLYVLDARSGERLWFDDVDDNPYARITGSPVVYQNRIFVPVSSTEVSAAGRPDHHCCTFRGNIAAYDLNTGEKLWHTHVMEEAAQVGINSVGNPIYAPSGAPIWQAPTVDPKRNLVYAGTGQNYSRPASATSDAVIAFDMDTGEMRWVFQTTEDDAFIVGCNPAGTHPNCPEPGPDLDIGAPILNTTLSNGQDVLIAGTKGGVVFGLDPDNQGAVLWETRVGRGSPLGGIHWGMTMIGDTVYAPNSDRISGDEGFPLQPGLHAIDMKTGEALWYIEAPERCATGERGCFDAYSAPATATEDLVFAGSLSGVLFAHDARTGEVVWEYDTRQEFETVNNVEARGGALDATGPVFSGDYMIVNSGYATFGQLPGNAVLVFKLKN